MSRKCEVCAGLDATAPGAGSSKGRLRRVLVEDRIVALCDQHAAEVQLTGVTTIEGLRGLFREPDGKRSVVERRAALDRRIFPARPEGRRRDDGRRADDTR